MIPTGKPVTITFADGQQFIGSLASVSFDAPETMAVGPGDDAPRVVTRPGKMTLELYTSAAPEPPPLSPTAPEAPELESPEWGTWS